MQKPDGERLAGLSRFPAGIAEVQPAVAGAGISGYGDRRGWRAACRRLSDELGPNDAWVKAALDGKSPAEAARAYIGGSKLADPAVRRQLLEGGEAAIAASTDPLIVLARRLDPLQRAMLKQNDEEVKSVETSAGEKLGKARFLVYGKDAYPDATFTLRLSYGTATGYPHERDESSVQDHVLRAL